MCVCLFMLSKGWAAIMFLGEAEEDGNAERLLGAFPAKMNTERFLMHWFAAGMKMKTKEEYEEGKED